MTCDVKNNNNNTDNIHHDDNGDGNGHNTFIQKINKSIHNKIKEKINSNIEKYEAFINCPFAKNVLKIKFTVEFNVKKDITNEDDVVDFLSNEIIHIVLYGCFNKIHPKKEKHIQTNDIVNNIKKYLNSINNCQYNKKRKKNNDTVNTQIKSIKYLYFGEKYKPYISSLLNNNIDTTLSLSDNNGEDDIFYGVYNNIKFYYLDFLDDIYLSNIAVVDLNNIIIEYSEEVIDKESNDICDYSKIPYEMKKGILTVACFIGDADIIKLNIK